MPAKRSPKKSRSSSPSTRTDLTALGVTPAAPLPDVAASGPFPPGVAASGPFPPDAATPGPDLPGVAVSGPDLPGVAVSGPDLSGVALPDVSLPVEGLSGATPAESKPGSPAPPKAGPPGGRDARLKGRSQRAGQTRFYAFRRS